MEHTHLPPYDLLIPLDLLLRHGHQYDLARHVPRDRLGGGTSRGCEVAGRELAVAVGGGDRQAARRSATQRGFSVRVVRAMSYATICDDRDVGGVCGIYTMFVLECIHSRDSHTYHDFFSKRASPEDVVDLVLFFLVR